MGMVTQATLLREATIITLCLTVLCLILSFIHDGWMSEASKNSLGGSFLTMFTAWSQFFMVLSLHIPILAVSVLLLMASFKNNTIFGFQGTDWLMVMGIVGLLGLFLFPYNGSRLSTLNAQASFAVDHYKKLDAEIPKEVPESLLDADKNSLWKDWKKKHDHLDYVHASFAYVPWWLFLGNYVVCILIGVGVIPHEDIKDLEEG